MFRHSNDGVSVPVSIRLIDGALLIGTLNCGMAGKIESLLSSDVKFVEFVSKDGQQRFIAHHQIASVEPLASQVEPTLATVTENTEPFEILGLTQTSSMVEAMAAFQTKMATYNVERWTGQDIPFEFSRFAAQKTRQLNAAFTEVKGTLKMQEDQLRAQEAKLIATAVRKPLFSVSNG